VYGLLAVAATLVIVASRDASSSSGGDAAYVKHLVGRTAAGFPITLRVVDGKLQSFDTVVRTECTDGRIWRTRWYPADGILGPFHQDGRHVQVAERNNYPDLDPPSTSAFAMDGAFSDDGASVSGGIDARGSWGRGRRLVTCRGETTFHATAQD
jgi:hypothetical protein